MTAFPGEDDSIPVVPADDPRAIAATVAVQAGDLPELDRLLTPDPWLAKARIGNEDSYRTLLHAATDWPGHFPNGPAVVERLVAAGADVNAHSQFSYHTETPLHWAASSDDVAVLDALLDAGADIEADRGRTRRRKRARRRLWVRQLGSGQETRRARCAYPLERCRCPRAAGPSRGLLR